MPATDHLGGQFKKKPRILPSSIQTVWGAPYGLYGNDITAYPNDEADDVDAGDYSGDAGDGGE